MPRPPASMKGPSKVMTRSSSKNSTRQRSTGRRRKVERLNDDSPPSPLDKQGTISPVSERTSKDTIVPGGTTINFHEPALGTGRQAPLKSTALTSFASTTRAPPSTVPEEETQLANEPHTPPRTSVTLPDGRPSPSRATSVPLGLVYRPTLVEPVEPQEGQSLAPLSPHRAVSAMARRSAKAPTSSPSPSKTSPSLKPSPLPKVTEGPSPTKKAGTNETFMQDKGDSEAGDEVPPGLGNPIGQTLSLPEITALPEATRSSLHPTPKETQGGPVLSFLPHLVQSRRQELAKTNNSAGKKRVTTAENGGVAGVGPTLYEQPENSGPNETDSGGSLGSGSKDYHYAMSMRKEMYIRPLTQHIMEEENPRGIVVNSQSQESCQYRSSQRHDDGGGAAEFERVPTTLVAGTPSTNSESSQADKLDLSQLARDGKAILNLPDPLDDLIPTQSVMVTQIVATQEVETQVVVYTPLVETQEAEPQAVEEEAETVPTEELFKVPEISPRKKKGYQQESPTNPSAGLKGDKGFWSSSSGTSQSIPGLVSVDSSQKRNQDQNASPSKTLQRPVNSGFVEGEDKGKTPAKTSIHTLTRGTREARGPNPLRPSRPVQNLPRETSGLLSKHFATATTAANSTASHRVPSPQKPATNGVGSKPVPPKRNPLKRRKSPAAIDMYLFAAPQEIIPEVQAKQKTVTPPIEQASGLVVGETLPADEPTQGIREESNDKVNAGEAKKYAASMHSDGDGSIVMDSEPEGTAGVPMSITSSPRELLAPFRGLRESPVEMKQKATPWASEGKNVAASTVLNLQSRPTTIRTSSKGSKNHSVAPNGRDDITPKSNKNQYDKHISDPKIYCSILTKPKKVFNDYALDSEETSSVGDDGEDPDYKETQEPIPRPVEDEYTKGSQDSIDLLLERAPTKGTKKRGAKSQGGRAPKRARRTSPKRVVATPKSKYSGSGNGTIVNESKDSTPVPNRRKIQSTSTSTKKPVLPPLNTNAQVIGPIRRNTRNRGISNARAAASAMTTGYLVLARNPETKTWFFGHAVERAGRSWEVSLLDGSPPLYVEPKDMRRCGIRSKDLVTVAPGAEGGEDFGDAIVVRVDERWNEERTVYVRIGGEGGEERYVSVRWLTVLAKNIKQWDDRKITHDDLEKPDGVELVRTPSIAPTRATSFISSASTHGIGSRSPHLSKTQYFKGVGFIVTNCSHAIEKKIRNANGYVYESWLDAYRFDGEFQDVLSDGETKRWIRTEGVRAKPVLTWVGNEHDHAVRSLFVISGKVTFTSKFSIGLALGVPCVSMLWIEACQSAGERVDWIPYLLPSHHLFSPVSVVPNVLPFQTLDYRWASYGDESIIVLEHILTHPPLAHRRILVDKKVLYIAPGCIEKLGLDKEESPPCQVPYVYCALALGAKYVEGVDHHAHASDENLLKYDLIVLADDILNPEYQGYHSRDHLTKLLTDATVSSTNTNILSAADFKMSMACGMLVSTVTISPH